MREPKLTQSPSAPIDLSVDDLARMHELKRTKLFAGGVLIASLAVLVVAKLLESCNAIFSFLAEC